MSLKAFHVFFIAVSTLLAAGFTFCAAQRYLAGESGLYLLMAVVGGLCTVGLPVYGVWFLKKMKGVGFV
jgi:hypothetical protein